MWLDHGGVMITRESLFTLQNFALHLSYKFAWNICDTEKSNEVAMIGQFHQLSIKIRLCDLNTIILYRKSPKYRFIYADLINSCLWSESNSTITNTKQGIFVTYLEKERTKLFSIFVSYLQGALTSIEI